MSGAMDSRRRIDPAEEARHRQVMDSLGVYDADWALSKTLEQSDVQSGQNRLLLTKETVRGGPIPKFFPELEELGDDGLNAQNKVSVKVLDAKGHEKDVHLRYLNSNRAYRVVGSDWRKLVEESHMCKGDRLDMYACRRGDGERCLFVFRSKGGGDTSSCTGRKRTRQPSVAARYPAADDDDDFVDAGRAADRSAKRDCNSHYYADADNTGSHRRDRGKKHKRAKSGHVRREDHMRVAVDDDVKALDFQGDYGCYKAEGRRVNKAPWTLPNYSGKEQEAAKGLLMLKYAIFAEHYKGSI
ncbi:uncharacterized protein [Triticum aestivum]|uniref:uncharacterized protein n=1 Tax=Triticum aestivum TaxID=4565 RepID=UPI001D00AD78|nr:uncharacterized protein LOC123152610 [Triticum aestivum]